MKAPAVILGFTLLLLAPASLAARGYEEINKNGDATVTLRLDKTTVALVDDRLTMTLIVEGPAPVEVKLPDAKNKETWVSPALAWKEYPGTPDLTKLPNGRERWQLVIAIDPQVPREVPLQVNLLPFRVGNGERLQEQTWKSIPIAVTSHIGTAPEEASLKNLHDISSIEAVPPLPDYRPYYIGGGIAAIALLGLTLALWQLRRKGIEPTPVLTPAEWALAELKRIDALDLPGEHEVERFHVLVSDVLRHYLERRYGLPATEQTTAEFLDGLRRSALLTPDQQDALRSFLAQCDLAKFARAEFSPFECKALDRLARDFIRQSAQLAPSPANGQVRLDSAPEAK